MMLRVLQSFKMSKLKNILVIDIDPIDALNGDFPQQQLENKVSSRIGKKYLSVCQQNEESILEKKAYKGVIIGNTNRLFLSIPTKHPNLPKFYNIHYLLNTGSPVTTLTRKALSAINQKMYHDDVDIPIDKPYQIGSQWIDISCLDYQKPSDFCSYRNINLLGMDFFKNFSQVILNSNFRERRFIVELIKNTSNVWNKKFLD